MAILLSRLGRERTSVENTSDRNGWGMESPGETPSAADWSDAVHLLRLVQDDYQGARRQLEKISHELADREALVNERLEYALLESTGHRTMRLVPYGLGVAGSLLGAAVLGGMSKPKPLPRRTRLEVHCLGRFELSCDGKTVTKWQSFKAKAGFQFLMTQPRQPVAKEVLMEALWPDCDPQAANNNLKAAIHGLRQTLGELLGNDDKSAQVLFVQGNYMLSPGVDLWIDVEEFERHWSTGRRLEKQGQLADAATEFELAEAAYRGDYLQDELYEEWTQLRREALRDTYLAVAAKLAAYSVAGGDYESCIIYSQKILEKDHCREDAYRWLMLCYSRLGQRNRALRWYQICRQTVSAELDALPDSATESIHRRLLENQAV